MVDSVNNSTAGASATSSLTAASTDIGATQDRFLKLLVTQMKNQDPLNPMDNAQVTSQMAQLSTVTGIDKLNSTVQALSSSMMATQSLQAVSMIGHVALTDGDSMSLANGSAYGGVELTQPADKVTVQITDNKGVLVRTLHLGAQESGIVDFSWDGMTDGGATADDGTYTFSAVSDLSGKKSDVATLSYGLVNSVAQSSSGVTVNIGNQGEVGLNTIRKIL
ncbi:MAG: flagellar hook assembly protein FlgD [Gammaproteobacteria bacterium]|nr:flagellar hook assembly protein FlgD [Gammaproteobacteria bacterium]MBU1623808.1 flagellar hook assembly protein FlgD [Gammaproteobacteria bacterium]MBU1982025.1 flagellar hook assembly protein FlgD [Gammaproteobacteria bacterium]